jgi:hypothetical protein
MFTKKRVILFSLILKTLLLTGFMNSGYAQTENSWKCSNCATENHITNHYCEECGTPYSEPKEKVPEVKFIVEPEKDVTPQAQHLSNPATLEVGMSKIFHMHDGNIVNGTIVEIVGDSIAVIKSLDGVLKIPTTMILDETADLTKKDGARFVGPVLSEDQFSISVKTPYGVIVILKRDIQSMDRYFGDKKISWEEERKRFYSTEELIDIFLDPTAFPLQPHTIYVSGLSLGYGFSENFQLRTQYSRDLTGDMNLHPMFRVYHKNTGAKEFSIAIGGHMFNHHPMIEEAERYSHWIKHSNPNGEYSRLDEDGAVPIRDILEMDRQKKFFWKAYVVLSSRNSLSSGRGKWGWHLGALTNSMIIDRPRLKENYEWDSNFEIPYRIWAGMDYDLTKDVKFLIEVFADNGHKYVDIDDTFKSYFDKDSPFSIESQKGDYQPVDMDFGFLYTFTEEFRVGVHFQNPYVTFYWKW